MKIRKISYHHLDPSGVNHSRRADLQTQVETSGSVSRRHALLLGAASLSALGLSACSAIPYIPGIKHPFKLISVASTGFEVVDNAIKLFSNPDNILAWLDLSNQSDREERGYILVELRGRSRYLGRPVLLGQKYQPVTIARRTERKKTEIYSPFSGNVLFRQEEEVELRVETASDEFKARLPV